jgi:cytochrome c peroxidase
MPNGETSPPDGRLPDADKGSSKHTCAHVKKVFNRMGFNSQEIVALLGAHVSISCTPSRRRKEIPS